MLRDSFIRMFTSENGMELYQVEGVEVLGSPETSSVNLSKSGFLVIVHFLTVKVHHRLSTLSR